MSWTSVNRQTSHECGSNKKKTMVLRVQGEKGTKNSQFQSAFELMTNSQEQKITLKL